MSGILSNYLPIVVFIIVAAGLSFVLLVAPFAVAYQQPDPEKLSAYECGFNDFSTFSRLFRKKTGLSPSQYRRNRPLP